MVTDESRLYKKVGHEYAEHKRVNHGKGEYVAPEGHTINPVENYFQLLKKGLSGIYHHVSEQHLGRYLSEFDFRYSHRKITDAERCAIALKQAEGRRLMYRRLNKHA